MNIIFGKTQAEALKNKYIVLELDQFRYPDGEPFNTYCVVENIPTESLSSTEQLLSLHAKMLEQYRERKWNACLVSIGALYDKWGSDMNTFYDHVRSRANQYLVTEPDDTWSHILIKSK